MSDKIAFDKRVKQRVFLKCAFMLVSFWEKLKSALRFYSKRAFSVRWSSGGFRACAKIRRLNLETNTYLHRKQGERKSQTQRTERKKETTHELYTASQVTSLDFRSSSAFCFTSFGLDYSPAFTTACIYCRLVSWQWPLVLTGLHLRQ